MRINSPFKVLFSNQQQFLVHLLKTSHSLMEQLCNFLSLSAIVSAGNPLEMIKSRFQTMNELIDKGTIQKKYQGIIDCAKAIKVNQGAKALWKGNSISIIRFFPNQKINNDVKNAVKLSLPNSSISNVFSGVIGGWSAAAVFYPIDTIRLLISTSVKKSSQTAKQILSKIKCEGGKLLFRGYSSSLLNIALFRGTYFGVFDTLKQYAENDSQKWISAYIAGLSAGLIVYPAQTLRKKKVIGSGNSAYKQIIKKTFYKEGILGFYRGCTLTPLQGLLGAVVLMYFDSKQKQV